MLLSFAILNWSLRSFCLHWDFETESAGHFGWPARMESHYQGEKTKAVAAEAKCTAATEDYDSKATSGGAMV